MSFLSFFNSATSSLLLTPLLLNKLLNEVLFRITLYLVFPVLPDFAGNKIQNLSPALLFMTIDLGYSGGDLAPSLGGRKIFFADQDF